MELLPEERKDTGLQPLQGCLPDLRFQGNDPARFHQLLDRELGVQVRRLKGVENSRARCTSCDTLLPADVVLTEKQICPYCSAVKKIDIRSATTAGTASS